MDLKTALRRIKSRHVNRVTSGPFMGWNVWRVPQVIMPENNPSTAPMSKAQTKLTLKHLGFADYADYLQSDLWKTIRAKVLRKHPKCRAGCGGNPATQVQVHHKAYTEVNLRGFALLGLVAICSACHETIEFEGGVKNSLSAANAKLNKRRKRPGKRKRRSHR